MTLLEKAVKRDVERIGEAGILVGIPSFRNADTIAHVVRQAALGMVNHFPHLKPVLVNSDGGSTDRTRDIVIDTEVPEQVTKIVTPYVGIAGKGSAFHTIFEIADRLKVKVCIVVDSDLRSITPEWIKWLGGPVDEGHYDFVTPHYLRYKYDGTITNLIVYPLVTALYGQKLRQPIGGDFGLSGGFIELLAKQDVWDTFVGQFGIDVWMTITAITSGVKICQANLGAKVHGAKDPAFSLGPMYLHVISTVFRSMNKFADTWPSVHAVADVPVKGTSLAWDPEPIPISVTRLVEEFNLGMAHFTPIYREILSDDTFRRLEQIAGSEVCMPEGYCDFNMQPDLWARVVYDIALMFNCWKGNTHKLIDLSSPLYFGQVASMANRTQGLDHEQAEMVVDDVLRAFVNEKVYFEQRWKEMGAGKICSM